ncbi:MAG: S1C family serine protease, partial [bacterium]
MNFRRGQVLSLVFLLFLWPVTLNARVQSDVEEMVEPVYESVIHITAVHNRHHDGQVDRNKHSGSGVIIDSAGYAVTNYHVIRQAKHVRVTLADRSQVEAKVVGSDPLTDIVLLKLEGTKNYQPASTGNSDALQVGERVYALGSPYALARSVTGGIISNTARTFSRDAGPGIKLDKGLRTGVFTSWIQHDASIHPGNSGGPLVNGEGEVIGINQLGGSGGLGFAIPINLVKKVVDSLRSAGEVQRSWFGLGLQSLQDSPETEGVLVGSVYENSPATEANIQPGWRL